MQGRPVHIRLLDLGEDKRLPAGTRDLDGGNSSLRGARLLLRQNAILASQAAALCKASRAGEIRIVYPTISDLAQFLALRGRVEDAGRDIAGSCLKHGVMFELPSACLQAEELMAAADFGCIGTNDLVCYLFGLDRNSAAIQEPDIIHHPTLWMLLGRLAKAARVCGKPLILCGEIALDSECRKKAEEAGIDAISLPPRILTEIRGAT